MLIDSHIHLWSDGQAPYLFENAPPPSLQLEAQHHLFVQRAKKANVHAALVVQPANHMFDHSYLTEAIQTYPTFFKGMLLANPNLTEKEAVANIENLKKKGFVAVRFNPFLFEHGMDSPVGMAMYKRAGELGMPVGVMAFGGLTPLLPSIKTLLESSPNTKMILDHYGFFRQPATGGLLGELATNDEESWTGLLSLAKIPQVYVKVSAFFRVSAELPPHRDLQPRLGALLQAYGASRLMWGSDFPFVLIGGNTPTLSGLPYNKAAEMLSRWDVPELNDAARARLLGGTAAELFGLGSESCSERL